MQNTRVRRLLKWFGLMALSSGLTAFVVSTPSVFQSAQLFNQVLQLTSAQYVNVVPTDSLYSRAAYGLVKQLNDPHSVVFTPEEVRRFNESLGAQFAGIGISFDSSKMINAVHPNTPSAKAGVLVGDIIIGVDSLQVADWSAMQVLPKMRGTAGSSMLLKVRREGVSEPVVMQITREMVRISSVPFTTVIDGDIGYVPFTGFRGASAEELGSAIQRSIDQGAKKVVIDLRGNGGGLINEAVAIASFFLPEGKLVVSMRSRTSEPQIMKTFGKPKFPDIPLVLLVDRHSASSSEIVAGALQDHDRALIVGSTTYGKGSVQGTFPLEGGYALKMTTSRWFTPAGRSIEKTRQLMEDGRFVDTNPDSLETDSARNARPRYTTPAGRNVFGGGSIIPDVMVKTPILTGVERKLMDAVGTKYSIFRAELSSFALEHRGKVAESFVVTGKMRDDFLLRLRKKGLKLDKTLTVSASDYIDRLIGKRIAEVSFGDSLTTRRYFNEDPALKKAVLLLKSATNQASLFSMSAVDEKRHSLTVQQQ